MAPIMRSMSARVILVFFLYSLLVDLIKQRAGASPFGTIGQNQSANQTNNSAKQYTSSGMAEVENLDQDDLSEVKAVWPEGVPNKTQGPPYTMSNQSWYMDAPRILKMGLFLG